MKSLFITFEGIDRSGKTTQIELFKEYLNNNNYNFSFYREPGSTKVSEQIREILLNKNNYISPYTELLLYIASRKQLLDEKLLKDLMQKKIVLCDRYIDSTIVYQGILRNISKETILELHDLVDIKLKPDLTFLFDISAKVSMNRLKSLQALDRMEDISEEGIEKLRQFFLELAKLENNRFVIIDGTLPIKDINKIIIDKFERIIKERTNDE